MAYEIRWSETKSKYGKKITYHSTAINHGNHVSVIREMFVEGEIKRQDLVHIPIKVIREINEEIKTHLK